jgi:hypothetical protein
MRMRLFRDDEALPRATVRGLRLEPTGRNPHHFTVGFDDLSEGVKGLMGCDRRTMTNPYHYG